jgi:periplasmic divalent cation tolerance protein
MFATVLVTAPDAEQAASLARAIVEERLAACVNIVPGIRSIYRWQDRICDDAEVLLVIKTTRRRFPALRERVLALHSYDVPEVILLPIEDGAAPFLDWLGEQVQPPA